jgi:hypothetical protein
VLAVGGRKYDETTEMVSPYTGNVKRQRMWTHARNLVDKGTGEGGVVRNLGNGLVDIFGGGGCG